MALDFIVLIFCLEARLKQFFAKLMNLNISSPKLWVSHGSIPAGVTPSG